MKLTFYEEMLHCKRRPKCTHFTFRLLAIPGKGNRTLIHVTSCNSVRDIDGGSPARCEYSSLPCSQQGRTVA